MKKLLFLTGIIVALNGFAQQPGLDYFIQQAKQNSPVIRDYQNQVLAARIDSQLLRASLGPMVNFISNDSYAPVINGWGYDEAITDIANISAQLQVSRNFLSRGHIAAQYRTIALQQRALLDTIRLSEKDLVRTITEQYITAYGDLLAFHYNEEVFELLKNEDTLLKKLTEKSVYKQTDYLNFYVTMQQQELTMLQSRIQYQTDYLTLNYLAGVPDTVIHDISPPSLADTIQEDYYHSVFASGFTTDSLRLVNERNLIAYEYRPRIGAYADGGYFSSLQFMPYKNFGLSVGLSLTVPIYDGRQKQMKLSQVDIRERTRESNRDFFLNQFRQQVAILKKELIATGMLVEKINRQIAFSHTLVVANGKLLQTGDITMKDYVTAINNYLAAQYLLRQNSVSRLRLLNQINYWNR